MANHENNGHGNSHDNDTTEGNRQYYPKGWWIPLAGLTIIALGFTFIGGTILGISGTDKWGKTSQKEGEKTEQVAPAPEKNEMKQEAPKAADTAAQKEAAPENGK